VNAEPIARVHLNPVGVDSPQKADGRHDRPPILKLIDETIKAGLVKIHPNFSARQIKCFENYDGVVIEGTGLGHAPITESDYLTSEHTRIFDAIKTLINDGTTVVMTTQCIFGEVNQNVYSPGRKMQEAGVIPARHDYPPETAFIRLAWLLSNHEKKDIPALFAEHDDHHQRTA
jgi:L-asparaginase/Glu-tRNA(Gln) amidotransferase subunit D